MKSLLLAAVVATGLMFGAASSAEAGGPHHGHHGGHHGHHGHHSYHHGHHGHGYYGGHRSHYGPSVYRSYYGPSYRVYRPSPYHYNRGGGFYINGRGFNFGVRF